MKNSIVKLIMFFIGALGYGLIELLWRGYTHWSMLFAGGICFSFFGSIGKKLKNCGIFLKSLIGSAFITGVELVFGIIFNVILKKNIWDYSKMPLNFGGQICALYSFFWAIISIVFFPLAVSVNEKLKKRGN